MSSPDSVELPHQEDGDEGKEKEKRTEEQAAKDDEGAGGQFTHEDVEVKAAGDWLQDHEETSSDWPRERVCHTHERAIPIQQTVEALDITEEGKWAHSKWIKQHYNGRRQICTIDCKRQHSHKSLSVETLSIKMSPVRLCEVKHNICWLIVNTE